MADLLKLTITTPQRTYFEGYVQFVSIPGMEGDIGVYSEHSPLLSALRPGIVEIERVEKPVEKLFVKKGFVEIDNNHVNILADFVESPDEIDIQRAEQAQKRAEKRLKEKRKGIDIQRASEARYRAEVRMKLAQSAR